MQQNKPQVIRLGQIRVAIWKNQSKDDPRSFWFSWNVEKRYQKDNKWETTQSFRDADAPIVILLLIVAALRMVKQLIIVQNAND